jgi:hypothetical protein
LTFSASQNETLAREVKFMKLAVAVCAVLVLSALRVEAKQTQPSDTLQRNETKDTISGPMEMDLVPLPLSGVPVIQLLTSQTQEAPQELSEEEIAKLLFEHRSKLPNSPHPKVSEKENSMCPSGVGNSCALLGGWVYYPDLIGLTYHDRTWWEAMKNPGMIAVSLTLIGATVLDIEGSQACIDKHTCREVNPLMRGSKAGKYAVAMPINAFIIWMGVREKQHGRAILPIAVMWVASVVHIYFGVGGLYQARGH